MEVHGTAELKQMHLPGEDGMRHCLLQHPADLTSTQSPGLAALPW